MTAYSAELIRKGHTEGVAEGRAEGIVKERFAWVSQMIKNGYAKEQILALGVSESDYEEIEKSLAVSRK